MSEHIGGHIQEEKPEEAPKQRYISKHPGNLPPSYSTFNTKNTNVDINNIAGNPTLHRGYLKHFALWGKPKFEAHDQPIFPIGLVLPEKCNFKQPPTQKHIHQKEETAKLREYIQNKPKKRPRTAAPRQIDFLKKEDFGRVPSYLEKLKQDKAAKELEEENEKRKQENELKKNKVNKNDIFKLTNQLQKKKEDLLKELAQYSHKQDMTQQTKKKKEEIEKQINDIEKDLNHLQRYQFKS